MAGKPYNGHPSWNAWNVSLWLANDEPLYRMALDCLRKCGSAHRAANRLAGMLPERTPDGARYSHNSLELALRGLAE